MNVAFTFFYIQIFTMNRIIHYLAIFTMLLTFFLKSLSCSILIIVLIINLHVNLVIKTDVQGTLEPVRTSLESLNSEDSGISCVVAERV